jgi:hypothetical protein
VEENQEKNTSEFPQEIMVFFAGVKRGVGQGMLWISFTGLLYPRKENSGSGSGFGHHFYGERE